MSDKEIDGLPTWWRPWVQALRKIMEEAPPSQFDYTAQGLVRREPKKPA